MCFFFCFFFFFFKKKKPPTQTKGRTFFFFFLCVSKRRLFRRLDDRHGGLALHSPTPNDAWGGAVERPVGDFFASEETRVVIYAAALQSEHRVLAFTDERGRRNQTRSPSPPKKTKKLNPPHVHSDTTPSNFWVTARWTSASTPLSPSRTYFLVLIESKRSPDGVSATWFEDVEMMGDANLLLDEWSQRERTHSSQKKKTLRNTILILPTKSMRLPKNRQQGLVEAVNEQYAAEARANACSRN